MAAQRNARAVAAAPGGNDFANNRRADFTTCRRRKPPFAKQFRASPEGFAIISLGWPSIQPVAPNVLVLPDGEPPSRFDWRMLRGTHVFCRAPSGQIIDRGTLRLLAQELAAVRVGSLVMFDGERVVGEWWRAGCERPGGAT